MDSYLELILIVFASFRLTRLIVFDKITEFIRRPFHETFVETLPDGSEEAYIEIKGEGIRYWIGELLSCHWCTGFWCSVMVYCGYYFIPEIMMPFISIFAIAGMSSIIQTFLIERG
ncbi:DUF1360 domain-containing protein [Bacillus sp. REN3]|uniref:DUF1360 domain-containing protein n=1 Tax=Bacillus sp. REN3 TaxID=2802440 RepID=UPI001AEE6FA4|nr:DUF1360 domain-containing protein [Bacillus sp. REN3]